MTVADDLAPLIGLANLAGFAASVWLLARVRRSDWAGALAPGAWVLALGTGLHVLNDYLPAVLGYEEPDDAYDHLFIHLVLLVAVVLFAWGLARSRPTRDAAA